MLSVQEAQAIIDQNITALPAEGINLNDAENRVLAEPIYADEDFPPFTRSAMDGYALNAEDKTTQFKIIETIHPGQKPVHALTPGTCARIFTGAGLPPNANCVIKQEDVIALLENIEISSFLKVANRHLRKKGEDFQKGEILLSSGTRFNAAQLAIAASVGATELKVYRQPKVTIFCTGDELISPQEKPSPFQIRNVNGILLETLVKKNGGSMIESHLLADEYDLLQSHLQKALTLKTDLVLFSGGASAGDKDHVKKLLQENGFTLHFTQVNVRPGQPLIFAKRNQTIAFGIPGNPVSHLVCFNLFIQLALTRLQNKTPDLEYFQSPLAHNFDYTPTTRETFWPAQRIVANFGTEILPLPWNGSGHISSLATADSLIRILPNTGLFSKGHILSWLSL